MKNIFFLILLTVAFTGIKAQKENPFDVACAMQKDPKVTEVENSVKNSLQTLNMNCGNTSPYYYDNSLYMPQTADDVIYIKLNFIFLTKPDGTGNFEQNNPDHIQVIDDIVAAMNNRLANLGQPVAGCNGYGQANFTDTKIQTVVNKIWKADPAWDYLYTGYDPNLGPLGGNMPLYPPSSDYYYTYLDSDPSIPSGINVVFANNGNIYNNYMATGDYSASSGEGWAAAEFPYQAPIDRKLRQFWPNLFNKYLYMKNFVVNNPTWGSQPWSVVRQWLVGMGYTSFPHELGHNLGLYHHDCGSNIMSYDPGNHDYFSRDNIATMYFSASVTSARQYFTDNSFKTTNINVTSNQLWDIDFRNYSNVKIDNNSSLKTTCKLIMAPESRVVVKSGSNFIIEGADVSSANNTSWKGIKVEGTGYCLILPDTKIDNGYFYVYADNTVLPNLKSAEKEVAKPDYKIVKNTPAVSDVFRIFPNPTGDFINIQTDDKIISGSVYNISGQKIITVEQNNKRIDVQSIPSGMYLLEVKTKTRTITEKFIKK